MNRLIQHRERLNLTQKELSEQSGISVRTIQRIEAGESPKGYTLKTLAKTLGISEDELLDKKQTISPNIQLLKYINLISLPFIIVPPLNIAAPLLLMYYKKEWTLIARQIVSIQIIWLLASVILIVIGIFIKRILNNYDSITIITICVALIVNLYIIIRNAFEIENKHRLCISLKSSLI
jgi:transcriptional regulator with XRE-family HTH domain